MSLNFRDSTIVGNYEHEKYHDVYRARLSHLPPSLRSVKKLPWDATFVKQRFVFFTTKGVFYAPVTLATIPSELEDDQVPIRKHQTIPVRFRKDFKILDAILVDLDLQITVRPVNAKYPIIVDVGEVHSFEFDVPYYVRGKSK